MGNDLSVEEPYTGGPQTLERCDLASVAKLIKDGSIQNIAVMVGAGISTSAGIPDFRSPKTGLYANLAKLNLPYPEAVFDISFFRKHPEPFYSLAHEMYPGKFRPTITHSLITLLEEKGLLLKCFTQNIDTLELAAGVPKEKVVFAHGSFVSQRCIECKHPYEDDKMVEHIKSKEIPHCDQPQCGGLVKPDIIFFGEALPPEFFQQRMCVQDTADLLLIMGTSLSVYPFAALPQLARMGTPRVLINKEAVGAIGSRSDDVPVLVECDEGAVKFARECGWEGELKALWAKTERAEDIIERERKSKMTKDELIEEEVNKLTKDVEEGLKIAKIHKENILLHGAVEAMSKKAQAALETEDPQTSASPELPTQGATTKAETESQGPDSESKTEEPKEHL